MAAGEELIRSARRDGGRLYRDGEPLTAEQVRAAIRAACAAAGAPAPPDIMVVSALTAGGGHDPGSDRCRPTCRSRSTSGRATRRVVAGPT